MADVWELLNIVWSNIIVVLEALAEESPIQGEP